MNAEEFFNLSSVRVWKNPIAGTILNEIIRGLTFGNYLANIRFESVLVAQFPRQR